MPKGKGKKKGGKGKNADKEDVKDVKVSKHPGFECLYLGDKELQTYGFKTGDGLLDVVPFKSLKKEFILEEVSFKGKMSAFHPFQSVVEQYEESDILFVWDPDEAKEAECNFYFCVEAEALNAERERLGISADGMAMDLEEIKRLKEEEEEAERQREIAREQKEEEDRIAVAIEELKKPLVAREWTDLGSLKEMEALQLVDHRSRRKMCIRRKRRYFGGCTSFSDQENVEGMNIELKSVQSGSTKFGFEVYRKTVDRGHQTGTEKMVERSTQSPWNRKIHRIVEYEVNEGPNRTSSNSKTQSIDEDDTMRGDQGANTVSIGVGFEEHSVGVGTTEKIGSSAAVSGADGIDRDRSGAGTSAVGDDGSGGAEIVAADIHRADGVVDDKSRDIESISRDIDDEKLEQFLDDVWVILGEVLTDNNLVNIAEDDLEWLKVADGETAVDIKTENLREIQSVVDLKWSRGRKLSAIQWIDSTAVAVSCVENKAMDQRMESLNRSRCSSILLWNLSHILLKAQTVLTAPTDIMTFKFHPKHKNLVVGGLENGQIALWDLNKLSDSASTFGQNGTDRDGDGERMDENGNIDGAADGDGMAEDEKEDVRVTEEEDDEVRVREIAPLRLSVMEKSHRCAVSAIEWVIGGVVMTENGDTFKMKDDDMAPHQFVTIDTNGDTMLFWDTAAPQQTDKERKRKESAKWAPVHSLKLTMRSISESKMFVDKDAMESAIGGDDVDSAETGVAAEPKGDDDDGESAEVTTTECILGSKLCTTPLLGTFGVGSERGGFCLLNVGSISAEVVEKRGGSVLTSSSWTTSDWLRIEDEKQKLTEKQMARSIVSALRWTPNKWGMTSGHHLGIKSVEMSPHFADMALTVGDWRFCLWRGGRPIFESPYSSSYLCCGCWSPSRPAVLFTAKQDGTIDIWDLLDQTHAAVISNAPICSTPITAIAFSPFSSSNLAVADSDGNLRIITIPNTFTLPIRHEKTMIARFYQKEESKTKALRQRRRRWEQIQKQAQEASNEAGTGTDAQSPDSQQLESDQAVQERYENMLVAFKRKLGIKE